MAADPTTIVSVPVRELVEFVCRRGGLGGDRGFVRRDRALAGTRGHQQVQKSRPPGYQKEVSLFYDVPAADFVLRVQGRIDGLLHEGAEVLLEEIKTVHGSWDGTADPLHWAQLMVYGFIYGRQHQLDKLDLRLTYLRLDTGALTENVECFSLAALEQFFDETAAVYLDWIREYRDWLRVRDGSIGALDFPFRQYRPGQRDLAVAAYRAIDRRERAFFEAPTGIGKTISALFPAIKALAEAKAERIFYLTARTTARAVAESAVCDLREGGLRLRSLTLTAKEKMCVRDGQPCEPQSCPLAQGYYDRRRPAMRAALNCETLTRAVLEKVGIEHQVCPFELGLDLSSWVDLVICDYNYAFDPAVYLRRHFTEANEGHVFLIDEAHNLVDRARDMFSADLSVAEIQTVRRAIQDRVPACAKALGKLASALRNLTKAGATQPEVAENAPGPDLPLFFESADVPSRNANVGLSSWTADTSQTIRRDLPQELGPAFEKALDTAEAWLSRNEEAEFRPALLELYFRLHAFARTAERYDERFCAVLTPAPAGVQLLCLDPSRLLGEVLAKAGSALFFSATLSPLEYYRDLLGGTVDSPLLQLPSPFPPNQLAVLVHDGLRTQFKDRTRTLAQVAEAVAALIQARAGNYFVYLPSYSYLRDLRAAFQTLCPSVTVRAQSPGMSEFERDEFLRAFAAEPVGTQVGFAVLGGAFGEGIDLAGDRLIGAVVVGVGLPQLCLERHAIAGLFQERTGRGFDYAYTFPGMNRVLQAAGRVIRSETDRGVVLLVDTRFGEARYRRLLPPWWRVRRVGNVAAIQQSLGEFWESTE